MKVEIRVPTSKRPRLLLRALESLKAQTHTNWIARVLDDSPAREGQAVIEGLSADRILYEPNPVNFGILSNLDRAFSIETFDQFDFVCVLEDDNYYLSDCLRANVRALRNSYFDIILRDQIIEKMIMQDSPGKLTSHTTYEGQYLNGPISHADLFASFFYSTGANNSSLCWRANSGLSFSTINYLADVVSQERLRTLCIDRDVLLGFDPLIVWRDNGDELLRPKLARRVDYRISKIKAAAPSVR